MAGSSFKHHFLTPLLLLLTFSTYTSTSGARPAAAHGGRNTLDFIKTSCSSTTYPRLCYNSLVTHASVIQTSPLLLAHTALSVTLNSTRSISPMMTRLLQGRGLRPREAAAVRDCAEQLSDSADQLSRSLEEMSRLDGSNFDLTMSDVQTWVSAAMTNEDMCTEGFSESSSAIGKSLREKHGDLKPCARTRTRALDVFQVAAVDRNCSDLKNIARGRVVNVAHLTSNALALVNKLASSHG